MLKYAINGRYLIRKQTGQERFANEIVRELDKIVKPEEFVIVVPQYAQIHAQYENIKIVKYGSVKSHLWEQISFLRYIVKNKLLSINLTTTCPFWSPGIVCIHDAAYFEISNLLTTNLYGKLSTIWHRILAYGAAKRAKKILTVSNYSKNRLAENLNIPTSRFAILRNGWQHLNRINPDESIFSIFPPKIIRHEYFMALSSLSPQKNFIWIKEIAKRNPLKQFIICGKYDGATNVGQETLKNENIFFTGYISDEQMKALMSNCKAFIHPAIYEGFGIPPLEALSCGAQLILSNTTCLPEIYENSAHYIDPHKYDYNLDKLLQDPVESAEIILKKYNWAEEAKKLLEVIDEIEKN